MLGTPRIRCAGSGCTTRRAGAVLRAARAKMADAEEELELWLDAIVMRCLDPCNTTWDHAAPGSVAEPIIDAVAAAFTSLGAPVSTGRFRADMQVTFTNDGPVTISLEI